MPAADVPEPTPPQPLALRPPPPVRLVPVPPYIAAPTAVIFGGLTRLRGRRALHPFGVVREAVLAVPPTAQVPSAWRALDGVTGVIRLSKSIGLPGRVPDVLGIALRFGGQDLLLATVAGAGPALQHVLAPAVGFDGAVFSSLLPHRVAEGIAVIQAQLTSPLPEADTYLDAVRQPASFSLALTAAGLTGGRTALGTVSVGAVIDGDAAGRLRFDPWRTGGGLRPVGPLQRMRAAAYAASRAATAR